jgi:competence protein ComEC
MPLLFVGGVAWAAGTALGLLGAATAAWLLAAAALGGVAVVRASRGAPLAERWETGAAVALIFGAGLVLGADLARADADCRDSARRARTWEATLLADAAPGSFVRAELEGCALTVAIAVRQGTAPAGSVVRVSRAEPSESERGILLRDATIAMRAAPGALARWRSRVAQQLDARFGEDGPLVRALLIADTRGLAPELRERYTDAGLVHVLSISGMHVGIIGGALLLLVEALRLPAVVGRLAAVAITVLYVLAIGAPPPAVRSAALFTALNIGRILQRPVQVWATFALGALVPLIEPRTVLDLGWQLSVAGYAGVIVSGKLARRVVPEDWRGWRGTLARELIAGVLTTLATAPPVAWHFGRLSLVSPLSNLFAAPVVALLQPTLFLAMLVPSDAVANLTADASRPMLRALDAVAAGAASLPGAAVVVAPTALAAVVSIVGVVALLVAGWSRHWALPATIAGAALALLAWVPAPSLGASGEMEIHLIDVGQGDAVAIRTPSGRWVLVDAGRTWSSGDAGRATVIPYLKRFGGPLALFVLTHPHADHVGGAASVVRALRPAEVRDAAFVAGSAPYQAMLREAAYVGARWQRVRPGEHLDIDGVQLEFLAPDSAWTVSLSDPNAASSIVRARYGAVSILLTGDAESAEETWLLDRDPGALRATILKVGHHGSRTSTTSAFLEAVGPRLALVSVGAVNSYGHPSPEVMSRLTERGATVLRSDQLGTVVVRTDGERLRVQAGGHRWEPHAPLLPP